MGKRLGNLDTWGLYRKNRKGLGSAEHDIAKNVFLFRAEIINDFSHVGLFDRPVTVLLWVSSTLGGGVNLHPLREHFIGQTRHDHTAATLTIHGARHDRTYDGRSCLPRCPIRLFGGAIVLYFLLFHHVAPSGNMGHNPSGLM